MVDERRQRVAERLGHEHVAHRSEVAVAEGTGSLALAQRDRAKTGAQVLAEICSLAESERDDGENRLASMVVEPVLHRVGQQARDAEVPEHQLHERRDIAMIGNIRRDRPLGNAEGHEPDDEQPDAKAHRQAPRPRGNHEGQGNPV